MTWNKWRWRFFFAYSWHFQLCITLIFGQKEKYRNNPGTDLGCIQRIFFSRQRSVFSLTVIDFSYSGIVRVEEVVSHLRAWNIREENRRKIFFSFYFRFWKSLWTVTNGNTVFTTMNTVAVGTELSNSKKIHYEKKVKIMCTQHL